MEEPTHAEAEVASSELKEVAKAVAELQLHPLWELQIDAFMNSTHGKWLPLQ